MNFQAGTIRNSLRNTRKTARVKRAAQRAGEFLSCLAARQPWPLRS
jgi:hypothetical protein